MNEFAAPNNPIEPPPATMPPPVDATEQASPFERGKDSKAAPTIGALLRGSVVGSQGDDVLIDVGLDHRALVPRAEFNGGKVPDNGAAVDVELVRIDLATQVLHAILKSNSSSTDSGELTAGAIVDCKFVGMIKGGLEVQIGEARAFMPASHVDAKRVKDISIFLGQSGRCKIIEVGKDNKHLVVSRRLAVEIERKQSQQEMLASLSAGQKCHGVVRNLTDYGAFVDIGGVHGLLHVSDMRWTPVTKPGDVVQPGDEIDVVVLKVSKDRYRVSLGLKQTTPDPWREAATKYTVGMRLNVSVVRLAEFGAFVEMADGINGLVPLAEMSWGHRPAKPEDVVKVGDQIDVVVINVDAKRRRIGLSMRKVTDDPWQTIEPDFPIDTMADGKVTKLLDFGVLVELRSGVEGMIHISELSDKRVRSPGDVVSVGDDVKVRVLSVDKSKRRIGLSLKPASTAGQATSGGGVDSQPAKSKPKRKRPLRGGLSSHFDW